MNCTRILHTLSPGPGMPSPIMPVDMAMRICLASSPPLHSFLSSYDNRHPMVTLLPRCKPLRPCLSSRGCTDPNRAWTPARQSPRAQRKKKSVVFADSQGMSLTAVHVFKEFEEDPLADLQFHLSDLENATASLTLGQDSGPEQPCLGLVLDFPQPAADYLDFRNRLKTNQVCLENCTLQDLSFSGTVKVSNISFQKSVFIRTSFDSWGTFEDIPCSYLNNVYGCPDTDTFSFAVELPKTHPPEQSIEFCIKYQTQDQSFWDNNNGSNYRLVAVDSDTRCQNTNTSTPLDISGAGERGQGKELEFDRFGSPRTSAGIFPEWQSWGRIENSAPYW